MKEQKEVEDELSRCLLLCDGIKHATLVMKGYIAALRWVSGSGRQLFKDTEE